MSDFQQMLEGELTIYEHNERVSQQRNITNYTLDIMAIMNAARDAVNNMEGVGR